jgi:hypothetical protein
VTCDPIPCNATCAPPTHHWVYGAGFPGCLYDGGPRFAETREEAINDLLFVFGEALVHGEAERMTYELKSFGYYQFKSPEACGATYCEITREPGPMPQEEEGT